MACQSFAQQRPHIALNRALLLSCVIAMGVLGACDTGAGEPGTTGSRATTTATPSWSTSTAAPDDYAHELFALTNKARAGQGLPTFAASTCAVDQAAQRARTLAGGGPLEHADMGPAMTACHTDTAAENLSRSGVVPEGVVDAWMHSSGHRANIEDPQLTALGVACVQEGADYTCSEVFLGVQEGGATSG